MPVDLGLDGLMPLPGSEQARKLQGATARSGPVNLQLDSVTFTEKYIVIVNGTAASAVLPRHLAEQFISQLPQAQQSIAQIVPATADGKQVLLG